ncbi:MAG: glycosyltransferase family 2 protein [Armatimonadetes bacterium]|nr:glycosyltransferase family 2 protein [Armatimonadota bacterium]
MLRQTPVSTVIPNRNGADLLCDTLPPLLAELAHPSDEILVVDDASQDGSPERLVRDFPGLRILALQESIGFGAASNLGFREAQNDLVLLLNSDMQVTPGSVATLVADMSAPDVFAAGPTYVQPDGCLTPAPTASDLCEHIGAPAGGGIFRRDLFLSLGGFDPLYYPFYWEDIDLGWAAWRAGWRIVYDSRVTFLHLGSATISKLYHKRYVARVRARNRCLFGWKNFSAPWLRRRHALAVWRHILADILRRGDFSSFLGLLDALRMYRLATQARPRTPPARSDEEILAHQPGGLATLLRL